MEQRIAEAPIALRRTPLRKPVHQRCGRDAANDEQRELSRGGVRRDRSDRKRCQRHIEREDFADHTPNRKAVIGRALVKMRAVRRPERLTPRHPA
jgi:hypothetical protein